jgi:hypothetical protein
LVIVDDGPELEPVLDEGAEVRATARRVACGFAELLAAVALLVRLSAAVR